MSLVDRVSGTSIASLRARPRYEAAFAATLGLAASLSIQVSAADSARAGEPCFQGVLCPGSLVETLTCEPILPNGRRFLQLTIDAPTAHDHGSCQGKDADGRCTIAYNEYLDDSGAVQDSDLANALFLDRAIVWDDNESGAGGPEARWILWVVPFVGVPIQIGSDGDGQLEGQQPPNTRLLQLHGAFEASGCEWGDTGESQFRPQDVSYRDFVIWDWDWTVNGSPTDTVFLFLYESDECVGEICNGDDWILGALVHRSDTRRHPLVLSDSTVSSEVFGSLSDFPVDRDDGGVDVELTLSTPNSSPVARITAPDVVECGLCTGEAEVEIDGAGSTDLDADDLELEFATPEGRLVTRSSSFVVARLGLGENPITLIARDAFSGRDTDSTTVIVSDTSTPSLLVQASVDTLWPPDHDMVKVSFRVDVEDSCDGTPTVSLHSVTSSEADDAIGGGDGRTLDDIQGAAIGQADFDVLLRAERHVLGPGRVYTVTYQAMDDSGNATLASAEVLVPLIAP